MGSTAFAQALELTAHVYVTLGVLGMFFWIRDQIRQRLVDGGRATEGDQ